METHRFQTPVVKPIASWGAGSTPVTLRVTASDARRIVRALEETSVSLGCTPSGSRLAGSYIRLASAVRQQTSTAP